MSPNSHICDKKIAPSCTCDTLLLHFSTNSFCTSANNSNVLNVLENIYRFHFALYFFASKIKHFEWIQTTPEMCEFNSHFYQTFTRTMKTNNQIFTRKIRKSPKSFQGVTENKINTEMFISISFTTYAIITF